MSRPSWDHDTLGGGQPDGGGLRGAFGRIFGDAENPLGWALTIGEVSGIRVRLHLLFIIYAVAQVLWSIPRDAMGPGYTSLAVGALFVVVLLHEFGHCIACRAVGGEADQIIMWPLGGLASCSPPHHWKADLLTTLGGPVVNAGLAPITAAALWTVGHPDQILFNPLNPSMSLEVLGSWWLVALWWAHYVNLIVLAVNVLIPMYPLDGGRIVQAGLWARLGRRRAQEIAVHIGLVAAGVVGIFGLVADQLLLFGIAFLGGFVCWTERQRLRAADDLTAVGFEPGLSIGGDQAGAEEQESAREKKHREREAKEQAEVDRILAKIARDGMKSLSLTERRTLRRATKRRQRG